eukprot:TRINITY_DN2832_c2_g2_i1.p1 TRINITY_DN2832_c2_g2~~TRINITY_DN2832_c2_g2_i1.p1  ORF type:complete len:233 (-),score=39.04 TRINITY_DN2832_c2_g2_i1:147-845(-)
MRIVHFFIAALFIVGCLAGTPYVCQGKTKDTRAFLRDMGFVGPLPVGNVCTHPFYSEIVNCENNIVKYISLKDMGLPGKGPDNRLSSIIKCFPELKYLRLGGNNLKRLSPKLLDLQFLQTLEIEDNKFSYLEYVRDLPFLQHVLANGNRVSGYNSLMPYTLPIVKSFDMDGWKFTSQKLWKLTKKLIDNTSIVPENGRVVIHENHGWTCPSASWWIARIGAARYNYVLCKAD